MASSKLPMPWWMWVIVILVAVALLAGLTASLAS
jgi:hypothetical protein